VASWWTDGFQIFKGQMAADLGSFSGGAA